MTEGVPHDDGLRGQPLRDWLDGHVEGFRGPYTTRKFKGGQSNPTYLVEAASGRYVLRRQPAGTLLASAHAVDREYAVIRALHGGAVPVARPLALCTDTGVLGSMFYVMAFVEGDILWDPALPDIAEERRAAYHRSMVANLAAIHDIDVEAAGLADFGRAGDYFQRQVSRWSKQYRASETQRIDAIEALIERLPSLCPADDGSVSLVHGDYRLDNLIWHPGRAEVAATVDWELSTLGHPAADLGYLCMALRLPRNPVIPGLGGLDREALGLPDEAQLLTHYRALRPHAVLPDWNFVLAFSFFRLAAIAQGVARRAQQGNAASEQANQAGAMTRLLAGEGLACLERAGEG
ncbi:phosphotransferase family protein [Alkalisalibacterium limincola]|uniref:Phosphotransferase family protein n=1 Tax=Alkalisalibacterium limincola TaxID=2699169 RepID=A0A5C8KRS2_9GAMM|nr:phosphotransferase family protein [Alkalisalibacterium limincola]TXK62665.1 phosphotransferase family protein [Alkalisalibacterium limincola]